jgi:phage shock protein PspC (stress-responsive transcriptional regulator)
MPEDTAASASGPGSRARLALTRSVTNRRIAGVCGGLAEYFGVDATPIRLLWAILSIFCGAIVGGVIAYVVAWAIIPRSPETALTAPTPAPVA